MQIRSLNTLPVSAGIRPDAASRQADARPRAQARPAARTDVVNRDADRAETRRPPVFIQPMTDIKLSRTGETAVRTYRDVATAGEQAELVNRVSVLA